MIERSLSGVLRALAAASALVLAGCNVTEIHTIPCNDNSNCPSETPTCSAHTGSATGRCVGSAAASKLEPVAGGAPASGTVNAPLPTALEVLVSDTAGNPVTGVAVDWAVVSGGGSFGGQTTATTQTGSDGTASVTATLGKTAGPSSFSASAAGLAGSPQIFTVTGTAATAASFAVTFPVSVVARVANTAAVSAFDAYGNPTSYSGNVNVSLAVTDASAVLPQAFALTIPSGGPASVTGILLATPATGQALIVSDAVRPAITGRSSTFTVAAHASTTALTSNSNPSVFGQNVTFTASVTSGAATPTGLVTFFDGSASIGLGTLSNGVATLTTPALLGGSHSITAVYGGDLSFASSTSNAVAQVVDKAATATAVALTAGANPSAYGDSLTFKATVTSAGGTPTGTVIFSDGATAVTGAMTLVSGAATFTAAALPGGAHSITAVYSGDNDFLAGASPARTQTVDAAPTSISLVSNNNPSTYRDAVVFTATVSTAVSASIGAPSGTVQFKDGTVELGPPRALGGGVSTLSASVLTGGSHSITAVYSGDNNFATSTSNAVTQVVNKANTTTTVTLTSGTDPSSFNDSLTFTATMTSSSAGLMYGTVAFTDNGTAIPGCSTRPTDNTNKATCSTSSLTVGTHSIAAVYAGDIDFNGSTSAGFSQVVNRAAASVALVSDVNPSVSGQGVTFTATVTSSAGSPTGTVTFQDNGGNISTACTGVSMSSGAASCSASSLSAGTHAITAAYDGDTRFTASTSNTVSQAVNQAATTVALVGSGTPTVSGQSVTFTATVSVTSPGAGSPSGTVTFQDNGVAIGICNAQALSSAAATCVISTLAVGTHPVTAVYDGDTSFSASAASNTVNQVVSKAATSVSLGSNGAPTVFGQSVTFTATVSVSTPGAGSPTGTVDFLDGNTTICASRSIDASFVATCADSTLAVGSHSITAVYNGDASFSASGASNTVTQVVTKAATSIVVSSDTSRSVVGQSVTFTATLSVTSPGAGSPGGTVAFKDGFSTLCASQPVSSFVATCAASFSTAGAHAITAVYGGDTSFSASSSSSITQPVDKADTTVSVSGSKTPTVVGEPVTFTATVAVTSPGSATPSSTVAFYDDGNTTPIASCGSKSLNSSSQATCTVSSLTLGTHAITAVYAGDNTLNGSPPSAAFDQVVGKADTATTAALTSGPNPSVFGQSITFSATVAVSSPGAASTSGGTVTFQDNGVNIGTACTTVAVASGTASCTTAALATGTHSITAIYNGNSNLNGSTSNAVSQIVNKADTSIVVGSSKSSTVFGESVTFTATVSVTGNGGGTPAGNVEFQSDGAGIAGCASQPVVSGTTATCMTAALPVGAHTITAAYLADASYNTSSNTTTQTVLKASTTVASVVPNPASPSVFGQPVTFTANLTVTSPGAGSPSGNVTFQDNNGTMGCDSQTVASSSATCTVASLAVGSHSIKATYNGDGSFGASSASNAVSYSVSKAATATALATSAAAPHFGDAVTLTATVTVSSPGAGSPANTVTFNDNGSPIPSCGSQAVNPSTGIATCQTSSLAVGSHSNLTASYNADTSFSASTSNAVSVAVGKATPAVAIIVRVAQVNPGDPVTFQATVTAPNASGSPTGTVTFKSDGAAFNGTPANPATLTPAGDNQSSTALVTATLPPGPHTITGDYSGDTNYAAVTGGGSSPVSIASPPPPGPAGATATAISGGAAHSGKVFIAGGTTGGTASSPSRATYLFDPATSATVPGPSLTVARAFHTATAIGAGQVLVAGGNSAGGTTYEICTLDARPSCVPSGGPSSTLRCNAAAALVTSSPVRVLLAGGDDCAGGAAHSSWELWDGTSASTEANPVASSAANALSAPRSLLTATMLAEGSVLLAGGGSASADLFTLGASPARSSMQRVGPMLAPRRGHTATLLPAGTAACGSGGCVLIAGGVGDAAAATWEIFSTATASFSRPAGASELVAPLRSRHAAALLSDGRVLLAGGTVDGSSRLASTEYLDPKTLTFAAGLPLQTSRCGAAAAYAPGQDLLMLTGGGASVKAPELISAP